jgi:hypothetical protein
MELYTIFGLNVVERIGHSYETDARGRILHDAEGRGTTKPRKFNDYIIYAYSGEVYYAIYLKESHGASFGGHLCTTGHMKIEVSPYPTIADLTHYPIKPLRVYANFEAREYWFDEDADVGLHNEDCTRLFCYSGLGSGDERVPDGYVIVNMDLFWEREKNEFLSKL